MSPTDGEPVGSLGDEAAKLLGAVADWAREQGSDLGTGVAAVAGQAASVARQLDDHVATDDAECRYCPICRSVHAVRHASPEVRAQLAASASGLLQAAAGLLAAAQSAGHAGDPAGGRATSVQHIDLDTDPDQDPDQDPDR
jgi:hypothetical protein